MSSRLRSLALEPVTDKDFKLGDKAARVDDAPSHDDLEAALHPLLKRLEKLQAALHAEGKRSLLLVLQGRDASGKDSVIRMVIGAFNPLGVHIQAFGPPSSEELSHDYLWRVHQAIPPRGKVGVFNRSHYEDVLVVRVRKLAPESVWSRRYDEINDFEKMLTHNGVTIRKCFLHVSREEQKRRLQARLDDPEKQWKFRLGDLDDRLRWDDYTDAYRDMLTKCSPSRAPWYIVPSDEKLARNYLIARMLVETLEEMAPEFPSLDPAIRKQAETLEW